MRPIGIDLFSGAGGLSLGFEQAGFDVAAAVDIDPVHCAVHHFNFPRTAVLPRSVDNLSAAEIRDAASIGDRAVDCVFGGAPCQGFSMIGHRALEDPRNGLVRHFVRLVAELKAKSFVFENVKGLTVGKHRSFLEELVGEFEDAGYAVRLPWRVLNAANYGTPQSRERLIVLGARTGEPIPDYPEPTTGIAGHQRSLVGLPDSPNPALLCATTRPKRVSRVRVSSASHRRLRARCAACPTAPWHFGYVRNLDRATLTSSARTRHTDRYFEDAGSPSETLPGLARWNRSAGSSSGGTDQPVLQASRKRRVEHAARRYRRCTRGIHESPADSLPLRPLHHGEGDGEAARLPRLVPPACHQMARCAADRQRRTAAAGQGDRRRGGEIPGYRSDPTARSDRPRRSWTSESQCIGRGCVLRCGSPPEQA